MHNGGWSTHDVLPLQRSAKEPSQMYMYAGFCYLCLMAKSAGGIWHANRAQMWYLWWQSCRNVKQACAAPFSASRASAQLKWKEACQVTWSLHELYIAEFYCTGVLQRRNRVGEAEKVCRGKGEITRQ